MKKKGRPQNNKYHDIVTMSSDNVLFLLRDRDNNDAFLINDIKKKGSKTFKIDYQHPNGRSYSHTVRKEDIHKKIVDVKGRFFIFGQESEQKERQKMQKLRKGTATAMMSHNLPKERPLSATHSPNTRKKNAQPTRMNKVTYPSPASQQAGKRPKRS